MTAIIAGVTLVILEILFDHWMWRNDKDDKPASTILRGVLLILFGCVVLIISNDVRFTAVTVLATIAVFVTLFDFSLNVSKWDKLPVPFYRPFHSHERKMKKEGWSLSNSKKIAYNNLTKWQKFVYRLSKFTKRFFWHGDEGTKSWYDLVFQRIPPMGELLFKGIILYVALHFYFNY
ncbi:hypothetical protein KAR91_56235 [Candidatus Pacearchaeota archaeon]|nr:hypothetical protein [Candidatus Pacearchaeota archaeon]